MGQIFHACAYDIENKICFVENADKFQANCYAHSGAVHSIHYLLRQKPYRVMWGGGYVVIDDRIKYFSRTEDLLGISTYECYDSFKYNNSDLERKEYYDKVLFIKENIGTWKQIDIMDEALEYFNWNKTHSVQYRGYLINHTKKLAVDLADYYKQSRFIDDDDGWNMCIDAVPVLTETGGGTQMAVFNGVCIDSTEELAGEWCGDLLQIVDKVPLNFEVINFCIAEIYWRAKYCYKKFGINEEGYLLKDKRGNLYEAALNKFGVRGEQVYIKVETNKGKINFTTEKNNLDRAFDDERKEGIKKGKKRIELEIAEKLLKIGLTLEQVMQGIELSEEEVMGIKKQLEL